MTNIKKKSKFIWVFFLIIIFVIIALVLCFTNSNTPTEITKKFFSSLKNGRYEIAYSCISDIDKKELSYDNFLKQYQLDKVPRQLIFAQSAYKNYEAEVNQNLAKVSLEITAPDVEVLAKSMMVELLPYAFSGAFSDDDNESEKMKKMMEEKLIQKLKDTNIPLTTKKEIIETIKQNDKWFIYLNIRDKNKISDLLEKAQQYEKEKKLNSAKESYEEILKLKGNSVEAEYKIKQLDEEIELFQEKQSYIKKLTLKDVKVFDYDEYGLGRKEKAFKGVLVNNGDKTLSEVEITVYMYDKENNVIAEEKFYPVGISYLEKNKPFKPKFVKDFGWKLEKYAPTGWSGKIKVEVTDIKFQ